MKKSLIFLTIFVCGFMAFDAFAQEKKKTALERDITLLYKSAKWSAIDLPKHLYKGGIEAIKAMPDVFRQTAKGAKAVAKRGAKEVRQFSAMSQNVSLYPVIISVNLAKRIKGINVEMVLDLFKQIANTIKNMNREQLLRAANMPYETFRDNFLRAIVYGPLIAAKYGLMVSSLMLFSPFLYFYWYTLARDVLYKIDLKVAIGKLKLHTIKLVDQLNLYVMRLSEYLNAQDIPEAKRQKYENILNTMKKRLSIASKGLEHAWQEYKGSSGMSGLEINLRSVFCSAKIKDLVSRDPFLQKILGYDAKLEEKRVEIPKGFKGGYGREFWPKEQRCR